MKTLIITIVLITGLFAERADSQSITNWGKKVLGAQLSITATNNVFFAGTNATIQCMIRNLSTNRILLDYPLMLPDDTHLFLVSSSGNILELTPDQILGSAIIGPIVKAGETYQWDKSIKISTNVKAGEYELKATRYIHSPNGTNYQSGKLVSNLLEVQIK